MYKHIKRIIDIFIVALVLIVFLIPIIVVCIAIKIDSEGPILFVQDRTGYKGKVFKLYKFRTMVSDNDVRDMKVENKVTKVGSFLRRISFDEIPQIINILKGDMSIIGPRPWIVEYYQNFTESQKRRVDVLPGITGLAQTSGRNGISVLDKINYDLIYVNNYSFKTDLLVIFKTIKVVLKKENSEITKFGIKMELDDLKNNYLQETNELPIINGEELTNI